MLELTKRAPFTASAASLAASSSATLSSIGDARTDRSRSGCVHVPLATAGAGREHDGAHERGAVGARLRDGLLGDARDLVAREVAARGEAPRAVDERANAEAVRLVVGDARRRAARASTRSECDCARSARRRSSAPALFAASSATHRELLDVGIARRRAATAGDGERRERRSRGDRWECAASPAIAAAAADVDLMNSRRV